MLTIFNDKYVWRGLGVLGEEDTVSNLRIFRNEDTGMNIVIITNFPNQPAETSDFSEFLFPEVCEKFKLFPDDVIWVEHYPKGSRDGQTVDQLNLISWTIKIIHGENHRTSPIENPVPLWFLNQLAGGDLGQDHGFTLFEKV